MFSSANEQTRRLDRTPLARILGRPRVTFTRRHLATTGSLLALGAALHLPATALSPSLATADETSNDRNSTNVAGAPASASTVASSLGTVEQSGQDLEDRPISAIRITGLNRVSEQLVRNNIRAAVGEPYDSEVITGDVKLLTRLGEFRFVNIGAELQPDGSVVLIYELREHSIVYEVQVVDNKLVSDQDIRAVIRQFANQQRDDFLIEQSKRNIVDLYREKGHYLTSVEIDETELEESGILLFRVIEGPRVRVRGIEFEGNDAFRDELLDSQIKTDTYIFLVRKGVLSEDVLVEDVAALNKFYRDRGYADVRVDRRIELSPDDREAKITFVIDEGPLYTLGSVQTQRTDDGGPLRVFSTEQIVALLEIKTGDVYSADKLQKSVHEIEDSYQHLGYYDVRVEAFEYRTGEEPVVDLVLSVNEGRPWLVGLVGISGNFLTRDKIARREAEGIRPGRVLDGTEIDRTQRALRATRLFRRPPRITVQDPLDDESLYRDVLIEVEEVDTGSVNFGVAVGSDSGVVGEISVNQRNFDLFDTPESLEELFKGRAFRGGGQRFTASLRPGSELFNYSVSLTEPRFMDTDFSLSVAGSYYTRYLEDHDQTRTRGSVSVGRRLGDVWNASVSLRVENVELTDISAEAPTELFTDSGPDFLTGLSLSLTRTTIDTFTRPGSGSRFEASIERVGLFGGDYDFNKASVDYTVYFTLNEDYLSRLTTLKLNTSMSYAFGGGRIPTYEQYYLGGRSFRGFGFREISPKGVRADNGRVSDEAVGGEWMFFLGAQYETPIFDDVFTGVIFVDSGTVVDEVGLDDYRVSVGAGVRLYIPQFGPVPIAFDFAVPIKEEDVDESQLFSFSAELPF